MARTGAGMADHHERIDKVLRDAIERMGSKNPGAGLADDVGEAIGQVAGETPADTDDAKEIGRIKGNHEKKPGKCREVSLGDLATVRTINSKNRAGQDKEALKKAIKEPTGQDVKPGQRKKPLRL